MYKLLAREHLGKPALKGHGGGIIPPKERLKVELNPNFAYGSSSYGWLDVTSIENYYKEAKGLLPQDYLFIRQRIIELVEAKAIDKTLGVINDPEEIGVTALGTRYYIGSNPTGDMASYPGTIAVKTDDGYDFLDPIALGYNFCSREEKEIAARLNIGLMKDHKADFGESNVEAWNKEYHRAATEARFFRIIEAETLINRQLPNNKNQVMAALTSMVIELDLLGTGTPQSYCFDHHKNYKDFGIVGSIDFHPIRNPNPGFGIVDYFLGLSIFRNMGLVDMAWQGETMSVEEIAQQIKSTLIWGV